VIALKHLTGWAVQITRADGSRQLATGAGVLALVWPKLRRADALDFARNNVPEKRTRVVKVTYAHPVEIPRA